MYQKYIFCKTVVCTIPWAKLITLPEFWEDKEEDSSVLIEAGGLVFAGG